MKTKRRWLAWVLEESAKPQPQLPWARNTRRAARGPRRAARA